MASIAWLGSDAAAATTDDVVVVGTSAIEDPPPEEEGGLLYRSILLFLLLMIQTMVLLLLLEGEIDGIDMAVTWMVVVVMSVPLVKKVADDRGRPEAMEALRRSNDAASSS